MIAPRRPGLVRRLRRLLGIPKTSWVIWEHPDELGYYAIKEEHW